MVHNDGPQCADTTAVAAREVTAGQRFLIGDASLGWNPSVRSTTRREFPIVYCWTLSDISKPRPQNKQPTRTSRTRQPTWRKLWGRTVRPCNLPPQREI